MLNWDTATDVQICDDMSKILEGLKAGKPQNVTLGFIMPESTYRLLSLEKRMTRVRKGPGKGRKRIVHVMRRG